MITLIDRVSPQGLLNICGIEIDTWGIVARALLYHNPLLFLAMMKRLDSKDLSQILLMRGPPSLLAPNPRPAGYGLLKISALHQTLIKTGNADFWSEVVQEGLTFSENGSSYLDGTIFSMLENIDEKTCQTLSNKLNYQALSSLITWANSHWGCEWITGQRQDRVNKLEIFRKALLPSMAKLDFHVLSDLLLKRPQNLEYLGALDKQTFSELINKLDSSALLRLLSNTNTRRHFQYIENFETIESFLSNPQKSIQSQPKEFIKFFSQRLQTWRGIEDALFQLKLLQNALEVKQLSNDILLSLTKLLYQLIERMEPHLSDESLQNSANCALLYKFYLAFSTGQLSLQDEKSNTSMPLSGQNKMH